MDRWRLLNPQTADAFTNMAIDEAIMKARIQNIVPNTLRFYTWKPSAVSIGRFQTLADQINIEKCRKDGVDIVRRISGGGAVYHDQNGEITYSIITKLNDLGCVELDSLSAYQKICRGLNEAITILGTQAEYRPPNPKRCPNLAINGKKISGNSQTSKKGILQQHGTFLLDINHKKMFSYLRVPWAKTTNDVLKVSKRRLTSAKQEFGKKISVDEAYNSLVKGFKKALDIEFVEDALTKHELKLAEKYRKERFVTEDWTFLGKLTV